MYLEYSKVRIALRTLGLEGLSKEVETKAISDVEEAVASYEKLANEYSKLPFIEGEQALFDSVGENWAFFKATVQTVLELNRQDTKEARDKMIQIFLVDCPAAAENYNKSITKLISFHQVNAEKWSGESVERSDILITTVIIATILAILVGISLSYYFANNISKILKEVAMMLSNGSAHIETFADEISKISNSLSSSITQQATALQQTTSAVQETSASVMSNAENAKKSTEVSFQSSRSANEGKKAVDEVVHSIKEISESIDEIKKEIDENNKEIAGVVNIINEIGQKTKVINEIVFQTKLLSFNASVEAARAGEHGKGFAVVAEEVGNLAQMSGNSAQEITDLLSSSIEKVESLVENSKSKVGKIVDVATMKVQKGTNIASDCNETLNEIIQQVQRVTLMVEEISSSCNEQSQSVKEITNAMNEIDSASHSNSESSVKAREFATHLNTELDGFRSIVIQLNQIVDGKKGAA